jgi:GNAT superfamily N-acetyltransferase
MSYSYDHLRAVRRVLEQPDIPDAYVDPNGTRFSFAIVTRDSCEDLILALEAQDDEGLWAVREWISEAVFYPGFVVSVCASDGVPAGFLSFDTRVFVNEGFFEAGTSSISVTLEPMSVFVAPALRGEGFGDSFVHVLAHQVPAILGMLAEASVGDLRELRLKSIDFVIKAECVSDEGSRFVRKALAACETALSSREPVGAWCAPGEIDDQIDDEEWTAPEEEPEAAFHFR